MKSILRLSGIILVVILSFSCNKPQNAKPPVILTTGATNVLYVTASAGGNVADDGGSFVSSKGVCWSTNPGPTTDDRNTFDGAGAGKYTSYIFGLIPGTKYYLKAYAINSAGTVYGDEVSFTTHTMGVNFNTSLNYGTVSDIDGNNYRTILIGTQTWMAENLATTHLNDGSPISIETGNSNWSNIVSPAYCWFANNDTIYKSFYGALYNWYAVNTGKLCPDGWHVASDSEWQFLADFLGGNSIAGSKLKESGTNNWTTSDKDATNESGFTALPSGLRESYQGVFAGQGILGGWWTATELDTSPLATSWARWIQTDTISFGRSSVFKKEGFSVRCIKY